MADKRFFYIVYGLCIRSDRPILEFEPPVEPRDPDIRIHWRDEAQKPQLYKTQDWHFEIGQDHAILGFKGAGVFRIDQPATIGVELEPDADQRLTERYLSGIVLAVLLHLRGMVIYHAAGVAINEHEAIAFIGESGAGKSTLAALLHLRGFSCITDDVVAVRVEPSGIITYPGYPRLKIDPRLARDRHIPASDLCPVQAGEDEMYLSLCKGFATDPLHLRALFFLEANSRVSLRRFSAREAMVDTIRYTLPARLLQQVGTPLHFDRCAAIANGVPAFALTRGRDISYSDQLVDTVLAAI